MPGKRTTSKASQRAPRGRRVRRPPTAPLATVEVPAPLRSLFVEAERTVADYFHGTRADPSRGSIAVGDERYVLVRARALSIDFLEMVGRLYADRGVSEAERIGRSLLFDIAHTVGLNDARAFHRSTGVIDPLSRLSTGPVHFAYCGWARVQIKPQSNPVPDESYALIYDHPYSFEADSWITAGRRASAPVCVMNAGYSSGWCEESFGLELTAAEVLCRACGDETCSFVMAPPQRIVQQIHAQFGDRVSAERLARVGPAAFFARKREEDLLRDRERLARDAAAASAAKNAFMTQMSHELRTPMNGIIGLSDLLGVSSLSAEQRETVQTLRHLASGLLGRIDALLDFANGDARVPEPEPEEFEVEELLSGALGLVAARAAKQRLDLEVFVDQRLPARLFGDRGRLHQVLANLLDNAVRVSACGALRLRAELQEHTAAGVIARFSVTDCGPGITEAQRARLFLPAGRSVGAAEHAGGGPGLGLAICRQVVELLGGAIDVRSGVGRGATFFFSVPLGDAPRSTAVPVSPQTKRTRVLVADDNPINCKVALSILERLGYDAEAAPDGRAALAALAASAFDVVLMDIEMPGMDGLETARRVRAGAAGEHHRGMPIIALTAHISVAEQRRCRAAGMNDFVSKPVHPERLRAKIERHLGRDGGSENPAAIGEGPEPDAPVLDVAELLARFDGDAALCKDLLRIFLRDAPGAVRALREARAAGDREALGREAHALRGAAAYVAARAVASCVQAVERCAAQGALDSVDPLLDTLDDALRSLGDAASRPLVPAG